MMLRQLFSSSLSVRRVPPCDACVYSHKILLYRYARSPTLSSPPRSQVLRLPNHPILAPRSYHVIESLPEGWRRKLVLEIHVERRQGRDEGFPHNQFCQSKPYHRVGRLSATGRHFTVARHLRQQFLAQDWLPRRLPSQTQLAQAVHALCACPK